MTPSPATAILLADASIRARRFGRPTLPIHIAAIASIPAYTSPAKVTSNFRANNRGSPPISLFARFEQKEMKRGMASLCGLLRTEEGGHVWGQMIDCHQGQWDHIRGVKSVTKAVGVVRNWADRGSGSSRHALVATFQQSFGWAYSKAVNGFPGLEGAEALAAGYAARHASPGAAVAALIKWQTGMASVAGFLTGCGGFVALPVAMPANLASALYIQVRLIAAIAHLRGHDIRSAEARAMVLACLTGSKAADTIKDTGVRFGARLARDAVGWTSPALFKKVEHAAGISAACVAASNVARFGKFVPVVGGVVAGGFEAAVTQLIGRTADRVFTRTWRRSPDLVRRSSACGRYSRSPVRLGPIGARRKLP
jgi:uncharacterized protein (DUF697 family)